MAGLELPWMKFFPAETLSDAHFQGWDMTERGAWFTLILVAWREGSIPGDQSSLARLLHIDSSAMRSLWSAIGSRFVEHPDYPGRLTSPRLEKERDEATLLHAKKAKAGKAGAKSRWDSIKAGPKQRDAPVMALPSAGHAVAMANDSDQHRAEQDSTGQGSSSREAAAARSEEPTRSGLKAATTKPSTSAEAPPLAPGEPSGALRGHATEGAASAASSGTIPAGTAEPGPAPARAADLIPTPAAVGHSAEAATFDAPPRSCPVLDLVELGPLGAELRSRLERRAEWKFLVATHARKAEVRAKLEEAVVALGVDAAEALCWSVLERRRRQQLSPWQPKAMAFFVELLEEAAKGGDPMPAEVPGVDVNQVQAAIATEVEARWAPLVARMNPAQREAYEAEKARLASEIRSQGLWTTAEMRSLDEAEKFLFAKWTRKVSSVEAVTA